MFRRLFATLMLLMLAAAPSAADDYNDCDNATDPDIGIRGCTRVIQSGGISLGRENFPQSLRSGDRGTIVEAVQTFLAARGYDLGTVDGVYGGVTHRALHAYRDSEGSATSVRDILDRSYKEYFLVGAHNNRGSLYNDKGEYDRAIADFDRALALDPNYYLAYGNRGVANQKKGDFHGAIADFNKTIELNPGDAVAHGNRSVAFSSIGDFNRAIADLDTAIKLNPDYVAAYSSRGNAYREKDEIDRAIADFDKAISLDPGYAIAYNDRGKAFVDRGEVDRAIDDFNKAIALGPDFVDAYVNRANTYREKGEFDRALADYNKVIRIRPDFAVAYNNRATTYSDMGEYGRAIADLDRAIELDPNYAPAYFNRGLAYADSGNLDRAISDYDKSIELDSELAKAYYTRGAAYDQKGIPAQALSDFDIAASLLPSDDPWHQTARERISEIEVRLAAKPVQQSQPVKLPAPAVIASQGNRHGNRIALVIGNSDYRSVPVLPNPSNDAELTANALRTAGFNEVTVAMNLDRSALTAALKAFARKADNADWAVIYFAGHGIETQGKNFLIPVDAALRDARDIEDEAVSLDRVLSSIEGAKKLRLVVLDACRNNPFSQRMNVSGLTRSVGRGLARVEPDGATLVAFAAKAGTTAEDGDGANSPFASSFAKRLTQSGVEINKVFRFVRQDVMQLTENRQQPFVYGSLPPDDLYFVPPE